MNSPRLSTNHSRQPRSQPTSPPPKRYPAANRHCHTPAARQLPRAANQMQIHAKTCPIILIDPHNKQHKLTAEPIDFLISTLRYNDHTWEPIERTMYNYTNKTTVGRLREKNNNETRGDLRREGEQTQAQAQVSNMRKLKKRMNSERANTNTSVNANTHT